MFIQKLHLKANTNYVTSSDLENISECLHLSYDHVFALTPYSSKSDVVADKLKLKKSIIKITPDEYKKLKLDADIKICPFLLVVDSEHMKTFGFDLSQFNNLIYISSANKDNGLLRRILLSKLIIKKTKSDASVTIFILIKMFPDATVVAKNEASVRKLRIFFKIFNISTEFVEYKNIFKESSSSILIFLDCFNVEILNSKTVERVFYIGETNKYISEILDIPLSLSGKYKYRIEDVYNAITPSVALGKKDFDYTRFKNISDE